MWCNFLLKGLRKLGLAKEIKGKKVRKSDGIIKKN
jgi:hypothetical protein